MRTPPAPGTHPPSVARWGYVRWSPSRSRTRQFEQVTALGVTQVFLDGPSLSLQERPGWEALFSVARDGDVVVVASVDRLGRTLSQLVLTLAELSGRHMHLEIAAGGGAMIALGHLPPLLAAAEQELSRERADEGRLAARQSGTHLGRPPALSPEQIAEVRRLRSAGSRVNQLARQYDVSSKTISRYLRSGDATSSSSGPATRRPTSGPTATN